MRGVSLRDYVDQRLHDAQRAVELAREVQDQRLDKLNELRVDVIEDRRQYIRQDVYQSEHARLDDRVRTLENKLQRLYGGGTILVLLAGVLGAVITKVLF